MKSTLHCNKDVSKPTLCRLELQRQPQGLQGLLETKTLRLLIREPQAIGGRILWINEACISPCLFFETSAEVLLLKKPSSFLLTFQELAPKITQSGKCNTRHTLKISCVRHRGHFLRQIIFMHVFSNSSLVYVMERTQYHCINSKNTGGVVVSATTVFYYMITIDG